MYKLVCLEHTETFNQRLVDHRWKTDGSVLASVVSLRASRTASLLLVIGFPSIWNSTGSGPKDTGMGQVRGSVLNLCRTLALMALKFKLNHKGADTPIFLMTMLMCFL